MDGGTSDWLVMDTIDPSTHSITGPGPDTLAVVPPVTLKAEPDPSPNPRVAACRRLPRRSRSTSAALPLWSSWHDAAERAAKAAAEEERWRALAEQVSMQVLQRVDLFTDTGLKTELAGHLQPIVDRASAELVDGDHRARRRGCCAPTWPKRSSARSRYGGAITDVRSHRDTDLRRRLRAVLDLGP